jgi:hypothetical protein
MGKKISFVKAQKTLDEIMQIYYDMETWFFMNRPLPDVWKVGQKIRYLEPEKSGLWEEGDIGYIIAIEPKYENTPAETPQYFHTVVGEHKSGNYVPEFDGDEPYRTSSYEVELVIEEEEF